MTKDWNLRIEILDLNDFRKTDGWNQSIVVRIVFLGET